VINRLANSNTRGKEGVGTKDAEDGNKEIN